MSSDESLDRSEIEAVLETRRELGAEYDAALVESFAERLETVVAARVATDLESRRHAERARAGAGPRQLALGIVSSVMGVPITAITLSSGGEGGATGLLAMLIGWAGLVGINVAHAAQSRGPR